MPTRRDLLHPHATPVLCKPRDAATNIEGNGTNRGARASNRMINRLRDQGMHRMCNTANHALR